MDAEGVAMCLDDDAGIRIVLLRELDAEALEVPARATQPAGHRIELCVVVHHELRLPQPAFRTPIGVQLGRLLVLEPSIHGIQLERHRVCENLEVDAVQFLRIVFLRRRCDPGRNLLGFLGLGRHLDDETICLELCQQRAHVSYCHTQPLGDRVVKLQLWVQVGPTQLARRRQDSLHDVVLWKVVKKADGHER